MMTMNDDLIYQEFMIQVLLSLEPRHELGDSIIFQTNEETEEMFFISQGSIDIGFELNA